MERSTLTAKVKARDVIKGWPRGRSTTTSWDNSRWRYWTDGWEYLSRLSNVQTKGSIRDLYADKVYHDEQSRMLERYYRIDGPTRLLSGRVLWTLRD